MYSKELYDILSVFDLMRYIKGKKYSDSCSYFAISLIYGCICCLNKRKL